MLREQSGDQALIGEASSEAAGAAGDLCDERRLRHSHANAVELAHVREDHPPNVEVETEAHRIRAHQHVVARVLVVEEGRLLRARLWRQRTVHHAAAQIRSHRLDGALQLVDATSAEGHYGVANLHVSQELGLPAAAPRPACIHLSQEPLLLVVARGRAPLRRPHPTRQLAVELPGPRVLLRRKQRRRGPPSTISREERIMILIEFIIVELINGPVLSVGSTSSATATATSELAVPLSVLLLTLVGMPSTVLLEARAFGLQ
mmetsp:Transcript_4628/g.11436  ORF Transcript_4628/g.11436 Transcript_4628/m.11436 type:complete len:261 (+) Transcript_4628:773-1555(+)